MADPVAHDRLELVSWLLLALATFGSAWCAYQSSLWGGEQTRGLARASVAQFASLRKNTAANRDLTIDVATFLKYAEAEAHADARLMRFIRDHARPELKPALEGWIADRQAGRADLGNPFKRAEYHIDDWEQAKSLEEKGAAELAAANRANAISDAYLLRTVLFALSLFLLGAVPQVRKRMVQRATLILGALAFVLTVISVVPLPRTRFQPINQSAQIDPDDGG